MEDIAAEVWNAHSITNPIVMDEPNPEFENLGCLLERRQHERRRQGPPTHVHWRRRLPEGEVEVVNLSIFGIGRATLAIARYTHYFI